jgi:hypothetical protein
MLVFPGTPVIIPSCIAIVLVFSLRVARVSTGISTTQAWLQRLLLISASAQILLIAVTAIYQREGRDYSFVEKELEKIDFSSGGVGISQRAWLALRDRVDDTRLHYLVNHDIALHQRSEIVASDEAFDFFDWLVLETWNLDRLCELYPWIDVGIKSGTYVEVARIKPPWKPLPWANSPCYDLTVFKKIVRQ